LRATCHDRFFLTRSTVMTFVIFLIWSMAVVLGAGIGTAAALSNNSKPDVKDKDKCKTKGGKKDCPPSPHGP
jgi:preprotein translocase subunit SecG